MDWRRFWNDCATHLAQFFSTLSAGMLGASVIVPMFTMKAPDDCRMQTLLESLSVVGMYWGIGGAAVLLACSILALSAVRPQP